MGTLKINVLGIYLRSSSIQTTVLGVAESEEELKSLLMKAKEKSEKVGLKLNIQKMKIMASGPITSWKIDGETVSDFIFWGPKITADGDCSHEIKRCLLLGRKVMTNLVQFSCSVMSDSLQPHELQHARPPCRSQLPEFTQTHVH